MSSSRLRRAPTLLRAGRPLVVEFIGTPGSGKTTLCAEMVGLLQDRGFGAATFVGAAREYVNRTPAGRTITRLVPRSFRRSILWQAFYMFGVFHALGFSRDHSALAREVLRSQLGRPIPAAARSRALYRFFHLAGRHRFLTKTALDHEAFVVDDGFLHRSVHLFASHVERCDSERVTAYVDLLPRPDLAVVTVASTEVCERRVVERGVWRHRRDLSAAQLSRYLVNAERVVNVAVERARERGWDVMEICTESSDLGGVRDDLAAALEGWLGMTAPGKRGLG